MRKRQLILNMDIMDNLKSNQWVSRTEGRDKSPVPQSEEKIKLEIKESVKAKNINGIEPDKRV